MSVVLGFDESPGARRALDLAIDIAGRSDELLVLVRSVAPPGGLGEEFTATVEALTDLARTGLQQAVDVATAAGVRTEIRLVPDRPAPALLTVADEVDARLIVVGLWGESPLRGAVLGSTPHKLLQLSDRPVLCVPAPADEGD
ncbi:universal stress protein [Nakamurella leprariae]|uniref:Universal stress protein n=1 Tax=Nakamurella leprariae TaxID=2803911 RepID=A0A938YDV0_9ACTN|nr:universal stress protein [Nakamurella leprariae]MBM9466364.1 universal stress protein [Nakamurella leprariae]